jgi:hypothetical protein
MYFPIDEWLAAFLLTVLVEAPIVVLIARRTEPDVLRLGALVLFANLATHPIVWFVITQILLVGTLSYVVVAETWAILAEAVFYAVTIGRLGWRAALAIAALANAASFLVGRLVLGGLAGWLG